MLNSLVIQEHHGNFNKTKHYKRLWFARTLEANKQIHKKRMQEQMQTLEFLRVIESLKIKS